MIREFKSLDEIKREPGYVEKIQAGKQVLDKPLGFYRFDRKIKCALATCSQPHNHGYVIITKSGAVVAVGNICGQAAFGEAFVEATKELRETIAHQQLLSDIEEKLTSLRQYRRTAEALMNAPRGARWFESAERSLRRICPPRVLGSLDERVHSRDAVIEYTRERTKSDPPPKLSESPKFITERLGVFRGLSALRPPSPLAVLERDILGPLIPYQTQTAASLADNKPLYQRFTDWYRQVLVKLNSADARLAEAPNFFETSNLRLLAHLAHNQADAVLLMRLVWNDVKGIVEVEDEVRSA